MLKENEWRELSQRLSLNPRLRYTNNNIILRSQLEIGISPFSCKLDCRLCGKSKERDLNLLKQFPRITLKIFFLLELSKTPINKQTIWTS